MSIAQDMPDPGMTYPPLDTLKPVAPDVWVVDGPLIGFGPPGIKLPFPTRMTVIRLADGGLFLHSPTELTGPLRARIAELGPPRFIVGPNRIHYWWIPQWREAFADARVFLAPRIRDQARGRIDFPADPLEDGSGYPWDNDIATLPIAGSYMTEVEFFHRASRTLVLTDLIENFELGKVSSAWLRLLIRLDGLAAPNGSMPRDMRFTFMGHHRETLREAVERMISWEPARIIIAHGRSFEGDGAAELRRAFKWLLD